MFLNLQVLGFNEGQSVEHAGLVGWNHVLDINKGVFSSVHLKQLQGLLDQVAQVVAFPLAVVDLVAKVEVFSLEKVHDWKNLSVIWNQGLSNSVRAGHQCLQNLESNCDDFNVTCVQGRLNWNDQLRDNWQHFGATFVKHVEHALDGQEAVRIDLFTDALKEDWKVVVIVELLNVYFPIYFVLWSVLNRNGQVSSVVK
jgi:hypothetical protein